MTNFNKKLLKNNIKSCKMIIFFLNKSSIMIKTSDIDSKKNFHYNFRRLLIKI